MNVHQSYFAITPLLFQKQRLRRRKHHLLSENWANPMAARDWGARWWFLQFTSFFHQISSSDQFFKFFLVFFQMSWSGAVFHFCLHFLHFYLVFCILFVVLKYGEKKTLTKSIWTPFPCQRPLRDWTSWYLVGGISISTIHDQFSNQCSRGCCCWCTDCQGWNIKLYTILVFISSLKISSPFHFHTYYLLLTHQ